MRYTCASTGHTAQAMLARLNRDSFKAAYLERGLTPPSTILCDGKDLAFDSGFADLQFQALTTYCVNMISLHVFGKALCPAVVVHQGQGRCESKLLVDRLPEPHRALLMLCTTTFAANLIAASPTLDCLDVRTPLADFAQFARDFPSDMILDPEAGLPFTAAELASTATGLSLEHMTALFMSSGYGFVPAAAATTSLQKPVPRSSQELPTR